MKKYLQITIVLGLFFLLVWYRQLRGSDQAPVITPQTPTPTPAGQQAGTTPTTGAAAAYKDGTYTGSVEDAFYGNMQVQAVISGGKITDIAFLQYPNDNRTTLSINEQAMPILRSEALQAQSASVDIVSGASDSSQAFQRSLATALSQAK